MPLIGTDEADGKLEPLTPDPLDPWPKNPLLVVLLVLDVAGEDDDVVALDVVPRDGRRVATSPPNALKATMAPTASACLSR